ncbi:MAG: hypothetical protein ABII88_07830 [Candidatus Omnitrophota bacterium]
MQKSHKIITILFCSLLVASGYLLLRFMITVNYVGELKDNYTVLSGEKNVLKKQLEAEKEINVVRVKKLENEIAGLSNVKNIQDNLALTQEKLSSVDKDFKQISQEKKQLEQTTLNLNNRISNLTKEFTKTLDQLKAVREELVKAQSGSAMRKYEKEIEGLNAQLEQKAEQIVKLNNEIKKINDEVVNLKKDGTEAHGQNKVLENQITRLEKKKQELQLRYTNLEERMSKKKDPTLGLGEKLNKLKAELSEKEKQLAELEKKNSQEVEYLKKNLEMARAEKETLQANLNRAEDRLREKDKFADELEEKLKRFDKQLTQREDERDALEKEIAQLRKTKVEVTGTLPREMVQYQEEGALDAHDMGTMQEKLNKVYALYDTAKAQVVKFSELLMQKELEIEKSKQRIVGLEQELSMIKGGAAFSGTGETSGQIADLVQVKAKLETQLQYEKQKYEDMNSLYINLKSQVVQVTTLLTRRESELDDKNEEIANLKREMLRVQQEYSMAQRELKDVAERQKRTLEDLSRSTRLNSTLQENLSYRTITAEDSKKSHEEAERLKKEIEVLLGK